MKTIPVFTKWTRSHVDYDKWMKAVDRCLSSKVGVVSADLPDIAYHDMYDNGRTVEATAKKALKSAEMY